MEFKGSPEPLDEDVIPASATAVHDDVDVVILGHLSEAIAGKLTTLVGAENFQPDMAAEGFLERLNTEIVIQVIGTNRP